MFQSLYPSALGIKHVVQKFRQVRVGILGDFCVDAYWEIAPDTNELSIETGKAVQRVVSQRYSPGGAGNVVINLLALGVSTIYVYGVIGDDLFGRELTYQFRQLGVDTSGLLVQSSGWATPVYGKPLVAGVEQQRMDIGHTNVLSNQSWTSLVNCLCESNQHLDFLIVNQQLTHGWCSEENARWMSRELSTTWRGRHIVDARDFVHFFATNALKVNVHEASAVLNRQKPDHPVDDVEANILLSGLTQNTPEAQFITRGERGILAGQQTVHYSIPGIAITGPVDPVGAGDASTAMLAACGAIQLDQRSSAILANLSASVTVRKLNQTGTASETELLDAARHLAYVYHPALADDLRLAKTFGDSDIEIVDDSMVPVISPESFPFKYAIFDHDGTISTLRQGWETVMESVMVRAITGNRFQSVERSILQLVTGRVHEYIEQTTGIQTIAQMDGLVLLVHEFGLVSDNEKLDAWGYKRLYNDALMAMINERIARLRRKELDHDDFIIKGAVEFLQTLCDAAVSLLLFSGTDEADVMREAELLGYAKYFDGGIYGAKPNSRADTKDEILTSLLTSQVGTQIDAATLGGKVLVIGDGPVELQLARRYGAVALGIASNEQRRFGLNPSKRRRLIRAGAHILTPDFSQARVLCDAVRQFRLGAPVDPPRL